VADGKFRELRERFGEWFLRRQALRAARAQLPRPDDLAARAYEQVRLLREVARQVAEPVEELPAGRRPAVLLSLYRDIVYWTLVGERKGEPDAPPDLATLWQQTPQDRLVPAAGDAEALETLRRVLVDLDPRAALDASTEDVDRVRAFADRLYRDLEAPRRRVDRILVRRLLHFAGAGVVVLAIVLAIRSLALGPNLVVPGHFHASSSLPNCANEEGCANQMFHTNMEPSPWVEFDLGGLKNIRLIEAKNRVDCCQERAVPIVAEVSTDHVHWKEVAHRETEFSTWTVKLPPTPARYVKLRVTKPSMLHLKDVVIR
jgi:hypothetical protein